MADKKDRLSKDLHQVRGFGAGSRLSLDIGKLKEYGWKVKTRECNSSRSRRVYFSYINPQGQGKL